MKQRKGTTTTVQQNVGIERRRMITIASQPPVSKKRQMSTIVASFLAQTATTASLLTNNNGRQKTTPAISVKTANFLLINSTNLTNTTQINGVLSGAGEQDNVGAIVMLAFFAFATIFGNASLLVCIFSEKAFRTSTNFFVASLTSASLLVGFVIMPLAIYVNSTAGIASSQSSLIACEIWLFFDFATTAVIIFNIVCICIVRYLAIAHPLFYSRGNHRTMCTWAPIVIWPVCIFAASPRLFLLPKSGAGYNFAPGNVVICAAGSPLDSAAVFVPIASLLFIAGNIAASVILLLIRRALIKRANELVERRYSVAVPSIEGNEVNPIRQNHIEQKLAQLDPLIATENLNNNKNNEVGESNPDAIKNSTDESAFMIGEEILIRGGSSSNTSNENMEAESPVSETQARRRRWATAMAAKRKHAAKRHQHEEHNHHHHGRMSITEQSAAAPRAPRLSIATMRPSIASVGLYTIQSIQSASQHPSSLTMNAAPGEEGHPSMAETEILPEQKNQSSYDSDKDKPFCKSEERIPVTGTKSIPALRLDGPEVNRGPKKTPLSHVLSLSPDYVASEVSSPPAYQRHSTHSATNAPDSPPPTFNTGRRYSRPNSGSIRINNFRKSERRLSINDEQNQLMIHRPKSASVYRRKMASDAENRLSIERASTPSGENPSGDTSPFAASSAIKTASSAMSVLVFEQLAGVGIARHLSNARGSLGALNTPTSPRPSYESQRSKSLIAAVNHTTSATDDSSSASSAAARSYSCHGRRFSCRSYRSGMSSRGLSIANLSMAIDGLVEGFLSDGVKATATIIMLVLLFAICGLPSVVAEMANFICFHAFPSSNKTNNSCVSDSVLNMAMWMSFVYNALNPLVYFTFNQQLRTTLCRFFFNPSIKLRKAFSIAVN